MNLDDAFALARAHERAGRLDAAEAQYRAIVAFDPALADVHYNLGSLLSRRTRLVEAAAAYERALGIRPDFPEAACNLGATRESLGQLDEAEALFRTALRLRPDFPAAWNNLGGVLKDLGRMDEAMGSFDRAVALAPDQARLGSNRLFAMHYSPAYDAPALLQAARHWSERHAAPLAGAGTPHDNDPAPARRLRVGYVSGYFRAHCQALFIEPVLTHHDHQDFEIVCYSDVIHPDGVTGRLKAAADVWRETGSLDDAGLAELIRHDGIDVLVDLTLHMAGDRLMAFARRPAPVQVTWLGYPGTTGLPAIGYRLTDPWLDPPGVTDGGYAEQSVRLPDSFWCYDPHAELPPVNPLPAASTGQVTFGCLNNFCKVHAGVLSVWARVLQAVPGSRLLMLAPPGASRNRVREHLGVSADRVQFVAYQPRAEYLQHYQRIDLGLDTFPYNGHTTSLDAFWMGVPVVSLSGTTAVSRAGLSLLSNLGLANLAATTPDEYVAVAVRLAADRARLAGLRAGLRRRMAGSPLMDAGRFTRNLEESYRDLWRRWCRDGP